MQRGEKIIAPFCSYIYIYIPYQVAQVRARIVFSAFACRATLRLPWRLQITCCGQTWLTTSLPRPSRLRRETRPRKRTRCSFSHRSCQTRTWQSWEAAAVPSSLRGCSSKCGRSSGICCNYACGRSARSSARSCDSFKKCYGLSCSAIVCTMPRRSRCTACSYERGRVLSATQGAVASCARRASKFVPASFFASLVPRTCGASFVSAFALAARPPRPIERAQSHTQSLVALLAGLPPTRARPELRSISRSFRPSARLSNFAARARESCLRKKEIAPGPRQGFE